MQYRDTIYHIVARRRTRYMKTAIMHGRRSESRVLMQPIPSPLSNNNKSRLNQFLIMFHNTPGQKLYLQLRTQTVSAWLHTGSSYPKRLKVLGSLEGLLCA